MEANSTMRSHPLKLSSELEGKNPWPRRNIWFAAALVLAFVGSLTLWASVGTAKPMQSPSNPSPISALEARRVYAEKQISNMTSSSHLIAIAWLACVSAFPLNGLIALAWVMRRRWPLRVMTAGSLALAVLGSYSLTERVMSQRRILADIVKSQEEIRTNFPKARAIVARLWQKQWDANHRLAEAEKRLNETDVIDQLSLKTLNDLHARRQMLSDAISAGREVLAIASNHDATRRAEFQKAGINPELSGAQAVYEENVEQSKNISLEPSTPLPISMEMYEIKLKLLNLTEQVWSRRTIDRRAGNVRIDGNPMVVREYRQLLKRLEDLEEEDRAQDEESNATSDSPSRVKEGQ